MRQRHSQQQGETVVGINMTPLIDMVFILLIFFIVTSSFVKETGVDINRPAAEAAERKERGNILIAVRANGEIWMDERQIDIRSVRANVERLHAENPEGSVVVVADEDSKTGLVVEVMDQARLAGVNEVSIAATQPQ